MYSFQRLSNTPLCIVPQLSYPFVCWWTSRLLPCPGYYKQCCNEHWGYTCLFQFRFPWYVCPGVGLLGCMAVLEKAVAPHSSILAWKIPWMEEPGKLQSTGSLRVRHDWVTSLSLFTFIHWRRKWQPTPVFLPGESQGRESLVGCCLWGRTESDTTEVT